MSKKTVGFGMIDLFVFVSGVRWLVSLGRCAAFVFWGCTPIPKGRGGGWQIVLLFFNTEASSFVFLGPHNGKSTQAASLKTHTQKDFFAPPPPPFFLNGKSSPEKSGGGENSRRSDLPARSRSIALRQRPDGCVDEELEEDLLDGDEGRHGRTEASCGELTDWELTDADRPYVEEFWERECLPGGYKHDPRLSLEAEADGSPQNTEDGLVAVAPGRGIHLVVSCSAPLTSLLRRALLGNNNGVGIGQIVAGPEGDGEVVDSDLYHLAGKDQDLEGKGKTLGGVLVLCRRPLPRSESWVKKWVGLLIDRFEPQTLHFCEDVQESNLGLRPSCGRGGGGWGGRGRGRGGWRCCAASAPTSWTTAVPAWCQTLPSLSLLAGHPRDPCSGGAQHVPPRGCLPHQERGGQVGGPESCPGLQAAPGQGGRVGGGVGRRGPCSGWWTGRWRTLVGAAGLEGCTHE